jgi:hypothetical protein
MTDTAIQDPASLMQRFRRQDRLLTPPGRLYFALAVIAFVIITVARHVGGFVSGVNTTSN